jgi:hypothetical protein
VDTRVAPDDLTGALEKESQIVAKRDFKFVVLFGSKGHFITHGLNGVQKHLAPLVCPQGWRDLALFLKCASEVVDLDFRYAGMAPFILLGGCLKQTSDISKLQEVGSQLTLPSHHAHRPPQRILRKDYCDANLSSDLLAISIK